MERENATGRGLLHQRGLQGATGGFARPFTTPPPYLAQNVNFYPFNHRFVV